MNNYWMKIIVISYIIKLKRVTQGELMSFPEKIFDKTKVNYVQKCAYVLNLIKNKNESVWLKFKVQFESLKPEESYEFYNTLVHEYQILLSDKPGEVRVEKPVPAIITKKVKSVKLDDTIKKVEVGKVAEKIAVEAKAAIKKAPVKKAAVKEAPVKKAAVKKAPVKKAAVKKAPVKKAAVKKAPVKKAAVKKAPVKKTAVKKAPVKKTAVKKAPVKKAAAKKAKKK
jgi:hypothetical protein